ncbi:MAG: hypothetical protein M3O01_00025 [Pseudomonadota bacterium]|nr:hypothetical protein [Pseudomonadota bacterium]
MNQVIDKASWVQRCVAHLVGLDPLLEPELARPIAEDMFARTRWREMGPENAAQTVFDFGAPGAGDRV